MRLVVGAAHHFTTVAGIAGVASGAVNAARWRLGRTIGKDLAYHAKRGIVRAANRGSPGAGVPGVTGEIWHAFVRGIVMTGRQQGEGNHE